MQQKTLSLMRRSVTVFVLAAILTALVPALGAEDVAYAQSAAPTLTAAEAPGPVIQINWTEVTGADSYILWKREYANGAWGTWINLTSSIDQVARTHTDSAVTAGNTYSYFVRAVTGGVNGPLSNNQQVSIASTVPRPGKPSLTVELVGSNANLSWGPVSNATSYEVQRDDGTGWTRIDGGSHTTTTFSELTTKAETTYRYTVRGLNNGVHGDWADPKSVTTPAAPSYSIVIRLSEVTQTTVTLAWNAFANATGYQVYTVDTSDDSLTMVPSGQLANCTAATDGSACVISSLEPETTYTFVVRATLAAGFSGYSNRITTTTPALGGQPTVPADPNRPSLDVEVLSATSVKLSWTVVTGATSYSIEYDTADTFAGATSVSISDPTVSQTDIPVTGGTDLTANTEYHFRIRANRGDGSQSAWSDVKSATTQLAAMPDAVVWSSTLTGAADDAARTALDDVKADSIKLTWTEPTPAPAGYKLWRWTAGSDWMRIGDDLEGKTEYEDMGLSADTAYHYRIRAFNSAGDGAWSTLMSITTKAVGPTSAPANFTAVAEQGGTSVILTWDAVAGAANYEIDRGTDGSDFATDVTADGSNTEMTAHRDATGITAGEKYYYRIRASNSGGDGPYAYASVTALATALPGQVSFTTPIPDGDMTDTSIKVTWTAPSPAADGYYLWRWSSGTGWMRVGDDLEGMLTYTDSPLSAGTTYHYRIRGFNSAGPGDWSTLLSATTKLPTPTSAPANFKAVAEQGGAAVTLTWDAMADATGGYEIGRGTDGIAYLQGPGAASPVGNLLTTYRDSTGLSPETTYYYRIRALNSSGQGPWATLMVTTPSATTMTPATPGAPDTVVPDATNGSTALVVTWTAPDRADSYKLYRWSSGTRWTEVEAGITGVTHTDTGLSPATTYYYRVVATNSIGDSGYSQYTAGTTLASKPTAAPGNFRAVVDNVAGQTTVVLTWNMVSGATTYEVERRVENASFAAVTGADALTVNWFSNSGLDDATMYYYRVRAKNTGGDGPWATTSVTTLAYAPSVPTSFAVSASTASSITLGWVAPAEVADTNGAATGFEIQRFTFGTGWATINRPAGTATSYTDSGRSANTRYYYRIRATNTGGESTWTYVSGVTLTQ